MDALSPQSPPQRQGSRDERRPPLPSQKPKFHEGARRRRCPIAPPADIPRAPAGDSQHCEGIAVRSGAFAWYPIIEYARAIENPMNAQTEIVIAQVQSANPTEMAMIVQNMGRHQSTDPVSG